MSTKVCTFATPFWSSVLILLFAYLHSDALVLMEMYRMHLIGGTIKACIELVLRPFTRRQALETGF